jgi:hypothetical protein
MNQRINLKTTILAVRNLIRPALARCGFLPIALALALFALSKGALAVSPPPDGDYGGGNTAEGGDALFSLTTGGGNTATGSGALFSNTSGSANMPTGQGALDSNITGSNNTAIGIMRSLATMPITTRLPVI